MCITESEIGENVFTGQLPVPMNLQTKPKPTLTRVDHESYANTIDYIQFDKLLAKSYRQILSVQISV